MVVVVVRRLRLPFLLVVLLLRGVALETPLPIVVVASSSAASTVTIDAGVTKTAAAAFQQQQQYYPTTRSSTTGAPRFSSSPSWRRYYHRRRRSHHQNRHDGIPNTIPAAKIHCSTTSTYARRDGAGEEAEQNPNRLESLVDGVALAGAGLKHGRQQPSTDGVVREGHDGGSGSRRRCTGRHTTTRRTVMLMMALLATAGAGTGPWGPAAAAAVAQAIEEKKPYAPSIENLLPATRVRLWINRAVDLTAEIIDSASKGGGGSSSSTDDEKNRLITELKDLLLTPKEFTASNAEMKASKMYLKTNTYDNLARVQREKMAASNRMMMDNNNNNNNPLIGISEGLERFGERNQFSTLRQRQRSLEKSNPIRAAFNAYTNNLVFTGADYQLNANKEEKSKLIRTYGQLPDVASVVKSDLDLRDLYRNQILTSIDDAKAELQYQLSLLQQQPQKESNNNNRGVGDNSAPSTSPEFDATDVLVFLKEAQSNCNSWFEFVPEQDMKDAMEAVVRY